MRIAIVAALLLLQSADVMQKALNAEAAKLVSWAADKTLIDAVRKQNAKRVSLAEVQRIDGEWMAGRAEATVKDATIGPCADRLRALVASDARYGETFVTDANGAIVCATQRTSDYWQGDETKWTRAFNDGAVAVFIDRPKLDDSAKARLAQISLPIVENGQAIGVLTAGVNIDRLK
jgi:type II secretory pathway pseudopilin PulG